MELSKRDRLIDDVKYGRKSSAKAEAEAERLRIGPLAEEPDPGDFNPMNEAWWSLPMTIAWIVWRSPDQVREQWNAYRERCTDWHSRRWRAGPDGEVLEGSFLEQRRNTTLSLLAIADRYDAVCEGPPRYARDTMDAKDSLWKALAHGIVACNAVSSVSDKRADLSREQWTDLEAYEERGKDIVRARAESAAGGVTYSDLAFARTAVVSHWPRVRPEETGFAGSELTTPVGEGYMTLSCAAQWIATVGNKIDPNALSGEDWHAAYLGLVRKMGTGSMKIIGMRKGRMKKLKGRKFTACRVHLPWAPQLDDPSDDEKTYLRSYPYMCEEEWEGGMDDALVKRHTERWTKIMIAKADVAERWPFQLHASKPEQQPSMKTGAPGRPSGMHLVVAEHRSRMDRDASEESVSVEARVLSDWFDEAHPDAPPLTTKTIENKIRPAHRQWKARPQN